MESLRPRWGNCGDRRPQFRRSKTKQKRHFSHCRSSPYLQHHFSISNAYSMVSKYALHYTLRPRCLPTRNAVYRQIWTAIPSFPCGCSYICTGVTLTSQYIWFLSYLHCRYAHFFSVPICLNISTLQVIWFRCTRALLHEQQWALLLALDLQLLHNLSAKLYGGGWSIVLNEVWSETITFI